MSDTYSDWTEDTTEEYSIDEIMEQEFGCVELMRSNRSGPAVSMSRTLYERLIQEDVWDATRSWPDDEDRVENLVEYSGAL